jgi:hypothetical protein
LKCNGLLCPAALPYGWVNNPEQIKIQGPVRGEAAFFAVREAIIDDRLDWTQFALDQGFSDQSHLIR